MPRFPTLLVLLSSILAASFAKADLPNVVLLMGDDHGWDETAYNGHPYLKTPVMDEMAAKGLRLDRFYSAAPNCSPTRGSFMTGRHPNRYGTFNPNWSIRPEEVTIAQVMKQAGYATGHFGKWHLGPVKKESPTSPGSLGFDEFLSHDNFFELNPSFSRNGGPPKVYPGESSEIVVEHALDFIEKTKRNGKPFFVVIWYGSPHEPYDALEKDLALYRNLPKKFKSQTTKLTSLETGTATERPVYDVIQERFAEITAMDRSIGQLRDRLDSLSVRDNTLLWYCGDNGTPGGVNVASPLRESKGSMYDGGIRVPGLIEWPARIKRPAVSKIPSVTSDILPTLCSIVGQPFPQRPIDGIDLTPIFDGKMDSRPYPIFFWSYDSGSEPARNPRPYIDASLQKGTTPLVKLMRGEATRTFVNYHHPYIVPEDFRGARAAMDGRYKLVIHDRNEFKRELFDLEKDPGEKKDIAEQKPELVRTLEAQLRSWQHSTLLSLTGADYR
ncbi:MAG: N-acetylgalactosamine-6-sulfatase [Opitutales bacterium TMED158]|nr:MAG: N-acetylgalactosamine-6-sulfatase [Opitutales bacterium TMED158]